MNSTLIKESISKIEEIIFQDPGNRGISSLYQQNNLQIYHQKKY